MKIKNITSKRQELRIVEFDGGREFTIYLEGFGETEIQGAYIPGIENLSHVVKILSDSPHKVLPTPIQEEQMTPEESHEESVTIIEDKFICDICGAEFASARGLNSHKNRAHAAE